MVHFHSTIISNNDNYDYLADFIGKTVVIAHIPKISNLYLEHVKIIRQYNSLLEILSNKSQ